MKVLRVSQDILRGSTIRSIKLQLRPDLLIEAGPKIVHPLDRRKSEQRNLLRWLLPEGYPQSVHDNYLKFTMWTGLQGISSSFIGVLSTQAMLGTLMNISSVSSDCGGWLSKGAAAATINWILKDGLGQAGGIALVSLLGSRLDSQARFLRFHSTVLFLIGSLLEFSIPFACTFSSSAFLGLASIANVLKNVSWMVVSATRAHFMKNFAVKGNLGDLTGKAASQMTLASLIGTGLGLAVLKTTNSWSVMAGSWVVSAAIGLIATHRSCKVGLSRQLSPKRIFKIIETLSKNQIEKQISRYIWTPEIYASRENFLFGENVNFTLKLNSPLINLLKNPKWIDSFDEIEQKKFCIAKFDDGIYHIWTLETASTDDKLTSIIKSAIDHFKLEKIDVKAVLEGIKKQGWDVEHFICKELDDKSRSLQINKDKED